MPMNKAPFTLRIIKINVMNKPTNVNKAIGSCKSPNPIKFYSFATTIFDIFNQRNAINRKITDVIPNNKEEEIDRINDYSRFVTLHKKNMINDKNKIIKTK